MSGDQHFLNDALRDLALRLSVLERWQGRIVAQDMGLPAGTAFPTSVAAGFVFFRTDLGMACYYDGTRWLTVHEYALTLIDWQSFGTASPQSTNLRNVRFDYSPAITHCTVHTRVSTTNDAADSWSISIQGLNGAATTSTTVVTYSTASLTVGSINRFDTAPTTAIPSGTCDWFRVFFTKTGTPGAIEIAAHMTYRLIVT